MSEESIGRYITTISKYLNYYINKQVKQYNLNKTKVEILMVLYEQEGISQNQLADKLMLDKITVTKQLEGLTREGYLQKVSAKEDKRVKELYVTDKGHNIKEELESILKHTTDILSKDFDLEENKLIRKLLQRLLSNIYNEVK